MLKFLEEEMTK